MTILRGRPYGGCAIIWRESLSAAIKPCNLSTTSRRVCGCILTTNAYSILILCVYFPTDSRSSEYTSVDLDLILHDIEFYIENSNCDKLLIGGDWNCDFRRDTAFVKSIKNFLNANKMLKAWDAYPVDYTYLHTDHVSTSVIDHFMFSENIQLSNACTLHSADNMSNHSAICIEVVNIELSADKPMLTSSESSVSKLAWYKASQKNLLDYKQCLSTALLSIQLPTSVLQCSDVLCTCEHHKKEIDLYCNKIINCIEEASLCIPRTCPTGRKSRTPGWKSHVVPYREDALFWHKLWVSNRRPPNGPIADNMRSSRKAYHYAIRSVRKHEKHLRKLNFLNSMLSGGRDFSNEIKKIKGKRTFQSTTLNGCVNHKDISEAFATEYKELYNACSYSENFKDDLMNRISDEITKSPTALNDFDIKSDDIRLALSKIKLEKSDGVFDLVSDNLKHAPEMLHGHLAILFKHCLIHGFLPLSILLSTIIPIPKDRVGDMTTSNNYRGIALCALFLKVFEYVILGSQSDALKSSDYQFAYKCNSSTTQCTWVARETINYYKNHGSDVYTCLLDCSKAFDKIRYDVLFHKLIEKEISPLILRTLLFSYIHSKVRVKWGGVFSDSFEVSNGVRQGAILSPILFNVYIDELVTSLKTERNGCWIGAEYYGCLVYADDIMLLAPTLTALQHMLKVCESFGHTKGLDFNEKKTICIRFHNSIQCCDKTNLPGLFLNCKPLKWCTHVKHLGHTISCCANFEKDIMYRKGQFIACVNNIMTEFGFAHSNTKSKLLQMYGTSFYGSCLWNLYNNSAKGLYTCWNIGIRKLFRLPYRTHTKFLEPISNMPHVSFSLKLRFIKFVQKLVKSSNSLIKNLLMFTITNHTSPTGLTISKILSEYNLCHISSLYLCLPSIHLQIIANHKMLTMDDTALSVVSVIKDIINCNEGTHECVLEKDEINFLLNDLCTM